MLGITPPSSALMPKRRWRRACRRNRTSFETAGAKSTAIDAALRSYLLPPNTTAPPGQIIDVGPSRPNADERNWALAAHLGTLALWIIAPMSVLLTKGQESAFVRAQAI